MKRILSIFAVVFLVGCASQGYDQTKSDTGLGTSPFSSGGAFRAANANAMNDGINDNDSRLDTVEALTGPVFSDGDGTYTDMSAISSVELGYLNGVAGNIYYAGGTDVPVADGGTGAGTAAGARTNLGAAASGANTDISSLANGVTTTTQAQDDTTNVLATDRFVKLLTSRHPPNLIVDPDFRLSSNSVPAWQTGYSWDTQTAFGAPAWGLYGENNRYGMSLTHGGGTYTGGHQIIRIPCVYGDIIRIQGRHKLSSDYADDGNHGLTYQLVFIDDAGNELSTDQLYTGVGTLNSWFTTTGLILVDDDTDIQSCILQVYIYDSGSSGTGAAYVDNVSVEKVNSNHFNAGTVANIPSSPATGDFYFVTDGDDNCDFDTGGGSTVSLGRYSGSDWECIGDGSGGVVQLDSLSDVDTTNAGTAGRPLISDGDGTYSFEIRNVWYFEETTSDPSDEAVGDWYKADGYGDSSGWDPADLHTSIGYDGAYVVACVATGSPGTYKALYYITGSEIYWLMDDSAGIITDADGITLTAAQMNHIIVMTGAGDVDIPADQCDTATGKWLVVKSTAAHLNSLTSNDTSDLFVLSDGTALDAQDELDLAGAAGSQVTVVCMQANKWWVVGEIGTCVDGGTAD